MRDLFDNGPLVDQTKAPAKERAEDENTGKPTEMKKTKTVHFARRITSEMLLEDTLPWHYKPGESYHCVTFGEVDALGYLRTVLKQQPLEYICLSTFSMAITDVKNLAKWINDGLIKHMDIYMGEIFDSKYTECYLTLKELLKSNGGGAGSYFPKPLKGNGRLRRSMGLCHRGLGQPEQQPTLRTDDNNYRLRPRPVLQGAGV